MCTSIQLKRLTNQIVQEYRSVIKIHDMMNRYHNDKIIPIKSAVSKVANKKR